MTLRLRGKGVDKSGKGLPPLPVLTGYGHSQSGEEEDRRAQDYHSMQSSGQPIAQGRPSPSITTTGLVDPYTHSDSPATLTATPTSYRSPRLPSASTSNLFDNASSPTSYHSLRTPTGSRPPFAPASPSTASHHSLAGSNSTATPRSKRFMFGTSSTKSSATSAPSVRSSHTMPEMMAYNDVDQWGVGGSSGTGGPRPPLTPRKSSGLNTPPDSGLRRKNSSSKMLAKGLSKSLSRMGSVMKRTTSETAVPTTGGMAGKSKNWPSKPNHKRAMTVHEEMGEGWERVDIKKELTEGDTSITRPFNVEHNLHVSPDLDNLPPAWLEALKAQGLSEEDLLLIAAARQRAGQRPLIRIVKGSLPPGNADGNDPTTPTTFSQARSRGLSTPAHLMLSKDLPQVDRPVLNKRFSWERGPTTPTASSSAVEAQASPNTPLTAFRKSLLTPDPPAKAEPTHTPRAKVRGQSDRTYLEGNHNPEADDSELDAGFDATPRKTKRWSDQLRGFQTSFSTIGGEDDDWGSSLTSVLNANFGLQTVQESEEKRQSGSSGVHAPQVEPVTQDTAARGHLDNPHNLAIVPPSPGERGDKVPLSSSPTTPRGNGYRDSRSWRKPVPLLRSPLASPIRRRSSLRSHRISNSQSACQCPRPPTSPDQTGSGSGDSLTPPATSTSDPGIGHARYQTAGQSHSSELDHELQTPSTGDHFLLSPTSSEPLSHSHLPRSFSSDHPWITQAKPAELLPKQVLRDVELLKINVDQTAWPGYAFLPQTPPRPDPRYSLPATAGYTESSPPSRSPTPMSEASNPEHDHDHDEPDHSQAQHHPRSSPSPRHPYSETPVHPSSPKRPTSKSSSHRDPLSRLDQAGTMYERASIALSVISSVNFSDARSSLTSLRDSYMHEAKVLKAYMRDPHAAELGGLRESDGEGASDPGSGSDHRHGEGEDSNDHRGEAFDCYRNRSGSIYAKSGTGVAPSRTDSSPRSSHSFGPRQSISPKPRSTHSPKSSMSSGRSRRTKHEAEPVVRQHPFAYQPLEADREEDALLALDDAARQMAKQRRRLVSDASGQGIPS